VQCLEQRTLETITRSRALLALSGEHLDRQEAGAKRKSARRDRQQAEVDRASAKGERHLAAWLPDPGELAARARAARHRAVAALQAFAVTEEEIARIHEDLAARHPERRDEFRRTAEQARTTAHKARELLRTFSDHRPR
jgi:hypothetical protein